MTTAELADRLSHRTGVKSEEIKRVIDALGEEVRLTTLNGEDVKLHGFGTFYRATTVRTGFGVVRKTNQHIRFRQTRRVK